MATINLVQMPFAGIERPSLAIGMFTTSLREAGVETEGIYAGIEFTQRIGLPSYQLIRMLPPSGLLGEWFFTRSAFRENADRLHPLHTGKHYFDTDTDFVQKVFASAGAKDEEAFFSRIQEKATNFVDTLAKRLLDNGARVVACTSMFDQQVASLALLRRVKELDPTVVTALGGANCAGAMGVAVHRCFPWIDFTATGEFDLDIGEVFGSLAREGANSRYQKERVPGLLGPEQRGIEEMCEHPASKPLQDMNLAAMPDYGDYFTQLSRSPLSPHIQPSLTVETSRGCWWGAKQHCTFCGLNADGMAFRKKSPARALEEFRGLSERYQTKRFSVADNIIDMSYFKEVLPQLAEEPGDLRFFYETKANIKRSQVETMAQAGCKFIQPGIESLHDETLQLMRKGTTACQNLQLLKYCLESGVIPAWGILCGFPDSDPQWVADVGRKLGWLTHLPPPNGTTPIRFDRFSPYHTEALERGLHLKPLPAYQQIYPVEGKDLEQLAYFFYETSGRDPRVDEGVEVSRAATSSWRDLFWGDSRPVLELTVLSAEHVVVEDTRPVSTVRRHELLGFEARVLLAAEEACTDQSLRKRLQKDGRECETGRLSQTLASLEERGLVWRSSRQWIALPNRTPIRPIDMYADDAVGKVDMGSYYRSQQSIGLALTLKSRQARRIREAKEKEKVATP